MFHNLEENRSHYDRVSGEKRKLFFERFDTEILESNRIVAGLIEANFEKLFPSSAGKLLDVGCGTGFYYPLLSRHADSIVGVDVSRSMLDVAEHLFTERHLENCRVLECSALELCFDDQSFDTILCWDFLHHVSDTGKALDEISRVLKPGGRFIAIEPNLLNPSIFWYHARRRSEWRLFTQNQFSLTRPLRKTFDIQVSYDNTIVSFLNERTKWIWDSVDRLTSIAFFRRLSFRYVIDGTKRANGH
ncbi:MAG: class I SAM-dependent methyltransferase [Planctomycetota bacterium]